MIEVVSFIVIYLLVSALVFVFIDYTIMNAMVFAEWTMDKKTREVFEDKKTKYLGLTFISLLWFIFVPIIIYNTKKEGGI